MSIGRPETCLKQDEISFILLTIGHEKDACKIELLYFSSVEQLGQDRFRYLSLILILFTIQAAFPATVPLG